MTLDISAREVLGALADECRYQHLRTAYALRRSVSTVDGSRHNPISSDDFYERCRESSMRDFRTDFVRALAKFSRWRGLRWRAARSSISLMVANDTHMGRGGSARGGGEVLRNLRS